MRTTTTITRSLTPPIDLSAFDSQCSLSPPTQDRIPSPIRRPIALFKLAWTFQRTRCVVKYIIPFQNLQLPFFIYEVVRGKLKVDFDAREQKPGNNALRNHGTKFRVAPDDVCRLYAKKERLV